MRNYGRIGALLVVLGIVLLLTLEWASRVGRIH
jgi:hypothetical protein